MNWAKLKLNNSLIDLKLHEFMHTTEMIETELLKLN